MISKWPKYFVGRQFMYLGEIYELVSPIKRSNIKGKKLKVRVKKLSSGRVKTIHFGKVGYQDFTQHKDKSRRMNYLARSAGIRNKFGRLTKDNPFSANFWARRVLWLSDENIK